jgi:hypothetical protein
MIMDIHEGRATVEPEFWTVALERSKVASPEVRYLCARSQAFAEKNCRGSNSWNVSSASRKIKGQTRGVRSRSDIPELLLFLRDPRNAPHRASGTRGTRGTRAFQRNWSSRLSRRRYCTENTASGTYPSPTDCSASPFSQLSNSFAIPLISPTLLGFLAADEGLETVKVTRRKLTVYSDYHGVGSLNGACWIETSSLAMKPPLAALHLPPTKDLDVRILPGDSSHIPLHAIPPTSLDRLPGLPQAIFLRHGATQPLGRLLRIQSLWRRVQYTRSSVHVFVRPINVLGIRELCLSEAQSVPYPLLGEMNRGALWIFSLAVTPLPHIAAARPTGGASPEQSSDSVPDLFRNPVL